MSLEVRGRKYSKIKSKVISLATRGEYFLENDHVDPAPVLGEVEDHGEPQRVKGRDGEELCEKAAAASWSELVISG